MGQAFYDGAEGRRNLGLQAPSSWSTTCRKRAYGDRGAAIVAFAMVRLIVGETPGRPVERGAYACRTCGHIHLTTSTPGDGTVFDVPPPITPSPLMMIARATGRSTT